MSWFRRKGHQPKKSGKIMPPPIPYKTFMENGTIEYDESEYSTLKGNAGPLCFADYDVFERRLELLDRLILIHDKDQYADYSEEISDVVTALMKDCDINPDTSDGETP